MVEKIQTLLVVEKPGQEIKPQLTLDQWIIEDPQRAKEIASQLLSTSRAEVFIAAVDGAFQDLTVKQAATRQERDTRAFKTACYKARKSLANILNLTLEPSLGRLGLRRSLEDQKRRELFIRAKQGNFGAFSQLYNHFVPTVDAQTRSLPSKVRPTTIAEVERRVLVDIAGIEWQGTTRFYRRLNKIIQNVKNSQFRKESREESRRERAQRPPTKSNKPPRDLLVLWISKHPDKYRQLINSLTERKRLIFEGATMDNLSREQIKARSDAASINAVKVTLHKARAKLAEKAGIHLSINYQPISYFADRGVSLNLIRDWIVAGEVKGALRLLGRYYLTEQIFEKYFGDELPLEENHFKKAK